MTLDEAIKELTAIANEAWDKDKEKPADAAQLGIEALKRLQNNRRDPEFDHYLSLPGETEE